MSIKAFRYPHPQPKSNRKDPLMCVTSVDSLAEMVNDRLDSTSRSFRAGSAPGVVVLGIELLSVDPSTGSHLK
jgi:hypothetical protein